MNRETQMSELSDADVLESLELAASLLVEEAARRVAAESALVRSEQRVAALEAIVSATSSISAHAVAERTGSSPRAAAGEEEQEEGTPPARAGGSPEQRPKDVGTPAETRGPGGAARTPLLRARPALPPVPNRSVSTCSLDELREVSAVWSAHAQQAVQESTLSPASTISQRSPLSLPPEGSPPRPTGVGAPPASPLPRGGRRPIPSAVLRARAVSREMA